MHRTTTVPFLMAAMAAGSARLSAQATPLADLNAKLARVSSSPSGARDSVGGVVPPSFVKCGSHWLFRASGCDGVELWRTDGTAAAPSW